MIKFSQVVGVPRSRDLLALQVLKMVSSFASELSYFVWTFPIGVVFPITFLKTRSPTENSVLDGELFLIVAHLYQFIFSSFFGKGEVAS